MKNLFIFRAHFCAPASRIMSGFKSVCQTIRKRFKIAGLKGLSASKGNVLVKRRFADIAQIICETKCKSVTVQASLSKIFPKALKHFGAANRKIFKLIGLKRHFCPAFSLVEMLMALLVASLLLAALAPVMTRKMDETVTLNGNMNPAGTTQNIYEIEYNSEDCSDIKIDSDGSTYCEGEFTVPGNFTGYMQVTVVGAGGGGGSAPTAGYTEYTDTDTEGNFTVPALTGNVEVTLLSGGGGGQSGGSVLKSETIVTSGNGGMTDDIKTENDLVTQDSDGTGTWVIPEFAQGKDILVTACGGGGGGGATMGSWQPVSGSVAYGGGSGGYVLNEVLNFGELTSFTYYIGGFGSGVYEDGYNNGSLASLGLSMITRGAGGGAYGGGDSYFTSSCYNTVAAELLTSQTEGGARGVGYGGKNCVHGSNGGQPGGGTGGGAHWSGCYAGGAGGGGGATQIVTKDSSGEYTIWLNAPGGGGGAGTRRSAAVGSCPAGTVAGGGGGGGTGGGAGGGTNNGYTGKGGSNGKDGSGYLAGTISTIFGSNYCNGGNGGVQSSTNAGASGKPGALRLTYIGFLSDKGMGGGAGSTIVNNKLKVQENEMLKMSVGKGGSGGTSASIDTSDTLPVINKEQTPEFGKNTVIYRDSTILLDTGKSLAASGSGKYGDSISLFNDSVTCLAGAGGTASSTTGGNASGYGCGGGGGYLSGNGGKGSGGYARIAWNEYWDTALNAYKLAQTGAGGSGASGNTLTHSISVQGGQTIKFKIGKGGKGAYILNNSLVEAQKGGNTVFGDVKAGGGYPGTSVSINSATGELINGLGGKISDVCHYDTASYLNNAKKCKKGFAGLNAQDAAGAKGADYIGYNYTVVSKDGTETKKEITGTGGTGGIQDTGNNANGKTAEGYSAGGGGAAIRNLGKVNSSFQGNIINNENKGGDGADGKIILEWWN